MLGLGNLRQFLGDSLGGTRWGESAEGDILSVLNQCCGFGSCHTCISHIMYIIIKLNSYNRCKIKENQLDSKRFGSFSLGVIGS